MYLTLNLCILLIIENSAGMRQLKIMSTSQGHVHKYDDLKSTIYNCNANIYFNKKRLRKNIIPNFAKKKHQILPQPHNSHNGVKLCWTINLYILLIYTFC